MWKFMQALSEHIAQDLNSYEDLHEYSVNNLSDFWKFYSEYIGLNLEADEVLTGEMPFVEWFKGAKFNYAKELLFPKGLENEDDLAIISISETGQEQKLSYAELRKEVAKAAAALKREGLQKGDRVAAFATNTSETVILLLACASMGVIFASCSPDFGYNASYSRFSQIEPKLIFASSYYNYNGKKYSTLDTIESLKKEINPKKIVLLPYFDDEIDSAGYELWGDWLEPNSTLSFSELDFNHPLYILFSSGTTGLPKAIIHRAGGAYLKHHIEQKIHSNIKAKERVFYFTTCGWMMWNWLVSNLAQAATIILFEGSPTFPDISILWKLVEKYKIDFFGTSARFIHSLDSLEISPKKVADLSSIKTIASTGSPLSKRGFEYVYQEIKEDVHLASIAGGTDIVACFMLGVPIKPVYAGEIQGPALGVDLAAYDDNGKPLVGQAGELVCRTALPSMPIKFWNDAGNKRYLGSYFDVYPNIWRHGDLIEITKHNGIIIYGRSDATLNPGGVRIGTAEIYNPLEPIAEIIEACAIGKKTDNDEEICLFLILDNYELDDDLIARIKSNIRKKASPRHVPKHFYQVSDLPRTRSGKTMEIAVSNIVNGKKVKNLEVVANPKSIDEIKKAIS